VNEMDDFVCKICTEVMHQPVMTSCAHIFCGSCFSRWVEYQRGGAGKSLPSVPCPACMTQLKKDDVIALKDGAGLVWRLYCSQKVRCANHSDHGGACHWIGPLTEYQDHMHRCVDGAAAFSTVRVDPPPSPFVRASTPTSDLTEIWSDAMVLRTASDPSLLSEEEEGLEMAGARLCSEAKILIARDTDAGRKDQQESARKLPIKVVLCRHFERLGTCRLGSKCTFAHGKGELQMHSQAPKGLRKTMFCRHFEQGHCWRGDSCMFAHGEGDLREKTGHVPPQVLLHKSQLCRHFSATGICWFGDSCNFAHGENDLHVPGRRAARIRD